MPLSAAELRPRGVPPSLTTGAAVAHCLWGPGTLLARDEHELVVAFESVGYRHLASAALSNGLLRFVS